MFWRRSRQRLAKIADRLEVLNGYMIAFLNIDEVIRIREVRDVYGPKTELGARRSTFEVAPEIDVDLSTAFITKEPITVVMSEKGWIREFYTLGADKLPGGRGNGEPIRLLVDMENDHSPIGMFVHNPERELIVASTDGYGFRVSESDIIASTRGGRKTLNVKGDSEALRVIQVRGDKIATIGENRKILVFNVEELPVMSRGKGVRLQKYKDGGLSDITTFVAEEGLTFLDTSARRKEVPDWSLLEGKRAQAGRMAPRGFSRKSSFDPARGL